MSFLLDTDICSGYLRGNRGVCSRFLQHTGLLHTSMVSLAELYSWVYLAADPTKRDTDLAAMLREVAVMSVDDAIARRCGQIRADLQRQGKRVPTIDLLIAATALVNDFTLVTHNLRHFNLVPGLRVEDWWSEDGRPH